MFPETGLWDDSELWSDSDIWNEGDIPVPAPEVVKGNRGKGKKQQIHTQGPWAYR
jgi:hypothetical protein